jgi:hypothetical protein
MHIVVAVIEPGAGTMDLKTFSFYNVLSGPGDLFVIHQTCQEKELLRYSLKFKGIPRDLDDFSLIRGILDSSCLPSGKVLSCSISANRTEL